MKKIIHILTLLCLIIGATNIEAKPKKSSGKKKASSSVGKTSTSQGSAVSYAIFDAIPLDGKIPTVETYGYKKSDGIKKVVQSGYEEGMCGFYDYILEFDKGGRLIFFSSNYDDAYDPMRFEFKYDDQGLLTNISKQSLGAATQDSNYTPFITALYDYKWKDGKISEIVETLTVDQGINYKGTPTHLDFSYDENGNLKSAICRENPKVSCQIANNKLKRSFYGCDYKKPQWYSDWHTPTKLDDLFYKVNKKKVPLKWTLESKTEDLGTSERLFAIEDWKDMMDSSTPHLSYDNRGNWIKRVYPNEFGETTFERTITYY